MIFIAPPNTLSDIRQGEEETLTSYLGRFNEKLATVDRTSDDIVMSFLIAGVRRNMDSSKILLWKIRGLWWNSIASPKAINGLKMPKPLQRSRRKGKRKSHPLKMTQEIIGRVPKTKVDVKAHKGREAQKSLTPEDMIHMLS